MNTKHFSICLSCIHQHICVLTAQKDKVWSCSEYEDKLPEPTEVGRIQESDFQLELA